MSEMNKPARRPDLRIWLVAAVVVLAAAALIGVLAAQIVSRPSVTRGDSSSQTEADSEGFADTVMLDGQTYVRNTRLKAVLLLGIDQSAEQIASRDPNQFGNGGRADAIAVLIVDPDSLTARVLEISRETMVDVDVYDQMDRYLYTSQMQLTLQYACASSLQRGNWLMKNKVSELLYGIPIDAAAALTMDGIPAVVDVAGGVTLTMQQDYTYIDPAFAKGATLTMDGAQAERFIHYRDVSVTGSNTDRMERHAQVLRALAGQLEGADDADVTRLQNAAEPYLETDVDADTLALLAQCRLDPVIYSVPGEVKASSSSDEFYTDEDALRRLVVELFYLPAA